MLYKEIEDLIGEDLPESLKESEIKGIYDSTKDEITDGILILIDSVSGKYDFDTTEIEEKRPSLIICDKKVDIYTKLPLIRVENSREILSRLYSLFLKIDYAKTDFIAITGTNGKTTTATLLYEILLYSGYKVGFIGTGKIEYMRERFTDNFYSMTTPDPKILYRSISRMQNMGADVIVMEVSSHAIALKKVSPIPFKFGLFTNLSSEHLDFHKDIEEYYKIKVSLFNQVENGIFNSDDKYSSRAMSECFDICNTTSIGVIYEAEARGINIDIDGFSGSKYIYRDSKRIFKVNLNLIGYHNIYNSLLALKCAIDYGVKPYIANEAISKVKNIDGRFELIKDSLYIIIDYAHTPEAFKEMLNFVNKAKKYGQKVYTIFGCGGNRDKTKRPVMAKIASKYSDEIIITEDNSRDESVENIIYDIQSGATDSKKLTVIYSRHDAIEYAINTASINDIILILGKGHEKYNLGTNGYTSFDEKEIVYEALNRRASRRQNEN